VKNAAEVGPTKTRAYSVRALTKTYETSGGQVHALRGIDLDLFDGEIIVLLGPSGSGKSTLLSLLGGLDRPTVGQIWFRDDELTSLDDRALTAYRRRHVGFVFQFYNLIPSLTVRENVELVTDMADRPVAPTDALELVGLTQRMDHFPAQLSGGEQQRVAIARAIAKRPAVLLCDEPTGAVDSKTGARVLEPIACSRSRTERLRASAPTQSAARHASCPGDRSWGCSTENWCAICAGFAARQR
jgi:putative ABC transport system ATP-binding protein